MVLADLKPAPAGCRSLPVDPDVVDAFLETARLHPHRPAILSDWRLLSYGQVAARVDLLASRLGPRCGVVGVLVTRSADTVIAALAVLAAGGTYCPIDPGYPAARQEALARAAGCRALIVTGPHLAPLGGLRVVELPDPQAPLARRPERRCETSPEDAAYLLFTSGSSGQPKGVVTPRRAITSAVRSLRELLQIGPSDRVLQFAALSWDTCFEEILPTLTAGATLVFDAEAYAGSFPRLLRMIASRQVTVVDLPTAFWHELVRYLVEERAALPPCLRLVVIGGEAARPARVAEWCSLDTGGIRLVNTYGCTETTLVTHAIDLYGPRAPRDPRLADEPAVPIGRALPHVVEHLDPSGELLVGGPSLALGYLDRPDATEERFRMLDVGDGPRRFFRTGDRVRRAPGGELVHLGRLDQQIKVRGIRVDPGEVEEAIARHPGVAQVAVAGVLLADHTAIVAYVVPRSPGGAAFAREILGDLEARLPRHLVPAKITIVSALVHTASGKIDRAETHRRHASELKLQRGESRPAEGIVAIFRRVLETDQVDARSDFFALGGDSLLATRVLSAIAREYGVELSFAEFMRAPVPEDLSRHLVEREGTGSCGSSS